MIVKSSGRVVILASLQNVTLPSDPTMQPPQPENCPLKTQVQVVLGIIGAPPSFLVVVMKLECPTIEVKGKLRYAARHQSKHQVRKPKASIQNIK